MNLLNNNLIPPYSNKTLGAIPPKIIAVVSPVTQIDHLTDYNNIIAPLMSIFLPLSLSMQLALILSKIVTEKRTRINQILRINGNISHLEDWLGWMFYHITLIFLGLLPLIHVLNGFWNKSELISMKNNRNNSEYLYNDQYKQLNKLSREKLKHGF